MRDWLLHYWDRLRTSLWFIPALMGAAAMALAWILLTYRLNLPGNVWWLYSGDADSARELLSTLLSGMLTATSLIVSITMVVLTLAAQQLGPRLIRKFIGDLENQAVLGLFLATILYILLVLRTLGDELSPTDVPHFAVTVGSALSVVSLFVLLIYVHKLARSIVSDTVVRAVADDLNHAIDRLLPEGEREPTDTAPAGPEALAWLSLGRDGYIQTIDHGRLVRIAERHDAVIDLAVRPGQYVLRNGHHIGFWPPDRLDRHCVDAIGAAIEVGRERSPVQDLEFSLRQLVEIALRALSSGINDPFTAIAVTEHVGSALARIFGRPLPSGHLRDAQGTVRVIAATTGYDILVGAAFDQIRQNGQDKPVVLTAMMDVLGELAPALHLEGQRAAVLEQLDQLVQAARTHVSDAVDLAAIERKYRRTRSRVVSAPLQPFASPLEN